MNELFIKNSRDEKLQGIQKLNETEITEKG